MTYEEYTKKHLLGWFAVDGYELCNLINIGEDSNDKFIADDIIEVYFNSYELDSFYCDLCNEDITDPKEHFNQHHN